MNFLAPKAFSFEEFMIDKFMDDNPELYKMPEAESGFEEWVAGLDFLDLCEYVDEFIVYLNQKEG